MSEAREIRKALKEELGLNARMVSVTQRSVGAVNVTIKVPVGIERVRDIAWRWEKVDRCEYTHEILSGGNTFVFVEYGDGVLNQLFDNDLIQAMDVGDEITKDGVTLERRYKDKTGLDAFYVEDRDNEEEVGETVDARYAGNAWARKRLDRREV